MSADSANEQLRIAVLISGGGTTLQNLLQRIDAGEIPASVALVISSSARATGLAYAQELNIPTVIVPRREAEDAATFSEAVFAPCRERGIELVVMGGFIKHVLIPTDYENRVMNIHPGLIPAFCGQGFYGMRVHQAVLEYGAKVSGCTVHFVDNEYDHGPIILQRCIPVDANDSPESLQQRVFEQECLAYPEAIRLFRAGKLRVVDRRVHVVSA